MSKSKELDKQVDKQEKEISTRTGPASAPVTCPSEYEGWTLDQLSKSMRPKYHKFAMHIAYHDNKTQAYDLYIAEEGSARSSNSSNASILVSNNPKIQAVIAKTRKEIAVKMQADTETNRENWISKTADIRDDAQEAKQFGPTVRAQELIGKAGGVLTPDHTSGTSKSVHEALVQIAGSNATLAKSLANQLGVKVPEIVDGEFEEEPCESDIER